MKPVPLLCELGKQILKFFLLWHHLWWALEWRPCLLTSEKIGRIDKERVQDMEASKQKKLVGTCRSGVLLLQRRCHVALRTKVQNSLQTFWPQNLTVCLGLWHSLAQPTPTWIAEKSKFYCRWLMAMWSHLQPKPKLFLESRLPWLTFSW